MHFDPLVVVTLLVYYLFSSAAGAMLPPEAGAERTRYGYWYRFVQTLAANGHRLVDGRVGAISASAEDRVFYVPWTSVGIGVLALLAAGWSGALISSSLTAHQHGLAMAAFLAFGALALLFDWVALYSALDNNRT